MKTVLVMAAVFAGMLVPSLSPGIGAYFLPFGTAALVVVNYMILRLHHRSQGKTVPACMPFIVAGVAVAYLIIHFILMGIGAGMGLIARDAAFFHGILALLAGLIGAGVILAGLVIQLALVSVERRGKTAAAPSAEGAYGPTVPAPARERWLTRGRVKELFVPSMVMAAVGLLAATEQTFWQDGFRVLAFLTVFAAGAFSTRGAGTLRDSFYTGVALSVVMMVTVVLVSIPAETAGRLLGGTMTAVAAGLVVSFLLAGIVAALSGGIAALGGVALRAAVRFKARG